MIFWGVLYDSCDFSFVCDLRDFMWHFLISQVRLDFLREVPFALYINFYSNF